MNDATTLDPPGSIAVVGAGALGIEAALYGRFLGYDVTLIEAAAVGHSMTDQARRTVADVARSVSFSAGVVGTPGPAGRLAATRRGELLAVCR